MALRAEPGQSRPVRLHPLVPLVIGHVVHVLVQVDRLLVPLQKLLYVRSDILSVPTTRGMDVYVREVRYIVFDAPRASPFSTLGNTEERARIIWDRWSVF